MDLRAGQADAETFHPVLRRDKLSSPGRVFQMGSNAGQNYLGASHFLHNHIEMALQMSSVLLHS